MQTTLTGRHIKLAVIRYEIAMSRAILMFLLAVASSIAMAEWVEVSLRGNFTTYADPATILRDGNRIKMWNLFDYNEVKTGGNNEKYMSQKSQNEYDCKEEQKRTLYFSFHSENMGRGELIYSDSNPTKWVPIVLGSLGESLWRFACEKR